MKAWITASLCLLMVVWFVGMELTRSCDVTYAQPKTFFYNSSSLYNETITFAEFRVREPDHRYAMEWYFNAKINEKYQYRAVDCTYSLNAVKMNYEYLREGNTKYYFMNILHMNY